MASSEQNEEFIDLYHELQEIDTHISKEFLKLLTEALLTEYNILVKGTDPASQLRLFIEKTKNIDN